jgi:hypothetical protein
MRLALRIALVGGGGMLVGLWTLAAVGAWWLLQAGAAAFEAHPTAISPQAVAAWTERPWVRYWLNPLEAEAVRDAVDWLLSMGGGPTVWLDSALMLLGATLIIVWAGGLLFGAAGLLAAWIVARWALAWWRSGPRMPWASRQNVPTAENVGSTS